MHEITKQILETSGCFRWVSSGITNCQKSLHTIFGVGISFFVVTSNSLYLKVILETEADLIVRITSACYTVQNKSSVLCVGVP